MDPINILGVIFAACAGISLIGLVVGVVLTIIEKFKQRKKYREEHSEELAQKRAERTKKVKKVSGIIFLVIVGLYLLYVFLGLGDSTRYGDDEFQYEIDRYEHRPDRF